jgi:hypothetical protein
VRAGVSRSTIDSVVQGIPFSKELRPRWRAWYRADVAAEPVLETDAEAAALLLHHVAVPAFEDEWRRGARDIAARLERLARARGAVVPGWIPVVGAAAESGELPPRPDRAGVRRLTRRRKRKARAAEGPGRDGGEPSSPPS